FGLQCCGCGHHVMLPRTKFVKAVRAILSKEEAEAAAAKTAK
ncbi:MAG: DUF951 family protein, partial [Succiniclasticum sp.]